jgi:aryl-alcohol dehydrogenase-like predicted oxidoreductase
VSKAQSTPVESKLVSPSTFYRRAQEWTVSSVGIGSYLGPLDDARDESYTAAVRAAVAGGINLIDTSLNYRNQRSERAIGRALEGLPRQDLVVCTKAGYLVPDAVPAGVLRAEDVVAGMHSMAPAFLRDQLARSLQNLGVAHVDVFYLHNPETQLGHVSEEDFYARCRTAFGCLEELAAAGQIKYYGAATWGGFREGKLSLARLAALAREVAGDQHKFRFIQLPMNLAMPEALTRGILADAAEHGVTAIASASLLQARLATGLPVELAAKFAGLRTDAQRALQFTRSTPGITAALVGMGQVKHVEENLALRDVPPLTEAEYTGLFER